MSTQEFEVVVVGGGVVGLCTAFFLAKAGKQVCLVERGHFGREASWAGGGLLSPIHPHHYPSSLTQLCDRSLELYPKFISELESVSGLSVEHHPSGLLRLEESSNIANFSEDNQKLLAFHKAHGRSFEILNKDNLQKLLPQLNSKFNSAIFEKSISQIRNPRLLKALFLACRKLGVDCRDKLACQSLIWQAKAVRGIKTDRGDILADETVITAGAWSDQWLNNDCPTLKTEPVHGMMILLEARTLQLDKIVIANGFYLIPRRDGQLLVGSTLEHRGYDKRLKVASLLKLLKNATELIPSLQNCYFQQVWSGLRPSSPDRLPFIGRISNRTGLIVASGHYRNGLLLAPVTAEAVSSIVTGHSITDRPHLNLNPFRPDRPIVKTKKAAHS